MIIANREIKRMPSRKQFKSNEEYNAWHSDYRNKHRERIREYNRAYQRKRREAKILEAIKKEKL